MTTHHEEKVSKLFCDDITQAPDDLPWYYNIPIGVINATLVHEENDTETVLLSVGLKWTNRGQALINLLYDKNLFLMNSSSLKSHIVD